MMGAGKSTVGSLLAARLGWVFVDLDAMIVERVGLSIAEIFARHGEERFRLYEETCLFESLTPSTPTVLALGGGTVERQANRDVLRGQHLIWIDADPEILYKRAKGPDRPLAHAGLANFLERYRRREPLFRELAAFRIDVTTRVPEDIVDQIVRYETNPNLRRS